MIPIYTQQTYSSCLVHDVGASVNDPVVANDCNIQLDRSTLTMATKGYNRGQKQAQKWTGSAKIGQEKVMTNTSRIESVYLACCGHCRTQEAVLGSTPYCVTLLCLVSPAYFPYFFMGM